MCVGLAAKIISVKDGVAMVDCTGAKRETIAKITDDDKSETEKVLKENLA